MRCRLAAAVVCGVLAWSAQSSADDARKPVGTEAREHFAAGVRLLQDPDGARYEDAYREFRAAYAASPSPKILGNIGFSAMKLERDAEAIAAYGRYLAEVPDVDADEREQIRRDVDTMRTGLAKITIHVDVDGASVVDSRVPVRGANIVNAYAPVSRVLEVGVRPGHHVFRVRGPNGESAPWDLEATPGGSFDHSFTLNASGGAAPTVVSTTNRPTPSRMVPWLVTAVGAVTLAGAAVTGAVVLHKVGQLDSACTNNACPPSADLEGQRSSAKTLMYATDAMLVGGGVLFAGGTLWLLLSGGRSTERASSSLRPSLGCSAGGCAATLQGRF
jgi:hypothetical protein